MMLKHSYDEGTKTWRYKISLEENFSEGLK